MSGHVQERLSAYLDGELSAGERREVESHLRACSPCARHLEELRAVDAAARELPVEAPPGYFDAFPARLRDRLPARRARRPPAWMWAAAAGLVLAVLAPWTLRRTASPVPEAARTDAQDRLAPAPPAIVVASPEKLPQAGATLDRAKTAPPAERRLNAPPPASAAPAPAAPSFAREQQNKTEAPVQAQKRVGPSWSQNQAPAAAAGKAADRAAAAEEKEPEGDLKTKRDEAPRRGLTESVTVVGGGGEEATRYRALLARRPASVGEIRQLHDAWRAFAEAYPDSPRADEARVRAIEALALAWRRGGDPADQERARRAALAYLASPEAPQHERVRALLESLPPPTP